MLKISEEELKFEARSRGYRPEMLEKVYRLLDLLKEFMAIPYLSDRIALKGGTAINLFCADYFPRLSVDLDFNYIGAVDRLTMQKERPELERIIVDIRDKLIPVLKSTEVPGTLYPVVEAWAKKLVEECKSGLGLVLPFEEQEIEFLSRIHQDGVIQPELITNDNVLCERIMQHPLLQWRIRQRTK